MDSRLRFRPRRRDVMSEGVTHRGYPGAAMRPTRQEVRRQIPGQDPSWECEGKTRLPQAGETRGAKKSL